MRKLALLVAVLVFLLASSLACNYQTPVYTPSPPQATAGALNSTYEAQATASAQPGPPVTAVQSQTVTASVTSTVTPTSSICELPTLGPGTYVLEVTPCP